MFWVSVLLVLFLGTSEATAYNHKCLVHVNGCSIPGDLPFFYKKKFTPACNKHDVCYGCGQYYHWSRQSCDLSFKNDMYHLCTSPNSKDFVLEILKGLKKVLEEEARCRAIAFLYYKAVEMLGEGRYNRISPGWCRNPCVERTGSPKRQIGYSEKLFDKKVFPAEFLTNHSPM